MAERKTRLSTKLREAIRLIVETGQKRADAAKAVGMHDDSLRKALKRPEVLAYRADLMQMLRTGAASRTIARAEALADTAKSESVRLDANTWLAGIAGIAPIARNESVIRHDINHQMPGLRIVFLKRDNAGDIIDQKPTPLPALENGVEDISE